MITTFRELKDFFNTCSHEYIGILYKTPNLNFSIELLNKYSKNDWINYIENEIKKYLNIYDFWCFYSIEEIEQMPRLKEYFNKQLDEFIINKHGSLWFVTNFITEITKVYSSNNLFDIIENLRL